MKRRIWLVLIIVAVGASLVLLHFREKKKITFVPPPTVRDFHGVFPEIESERSELGTKENPKARKAYAQLMLLDPKTGALPGDIRRREIRYSNRLPRKIYNRSGLRSAETTTWSSIGPYNVGGRTRAIGIDISNENQSCNT